MAKRNNAEWYWAALPLIAILLGLILLTQYFPKSRGLAFLGVGLLLAVELAVIGWLVNGRAVGAFIDNRHRLSLSKLQAGAWTVVVLAAFATAAAFNIAAAGTDPKTVGALAIIIPGELLLAMGISATSLVAVPALLSTKAAETPAPGVEDAAKSRLGDAAKANGKLLEMEQPSDASWADLVTGDEIGNAGAPDLGKIQQAFITLILLGCYAAYIYNEFSKSGNPISSLPTLNNSFVWLLGISHASYLAYKAAPHTTTGSGQ